jgi:Amidase
MLERAKDHHLSTGLAEIDVPFWSASQLARAIGEKKISSLELLNICLARVEKHNPRVNAIIELDIPGARKRAQAADDALMRGESSGPLHGIPITVKDSIDVAGFASTWGVKEFKDNRPARSAPIVDALTAAGAIVFGKTNIPWFALVRKLSTTFMARRTIRGICPDPLGVHPAGRRLRWPRGSPVLRLEVTAEVRYAFLRTIAEFMRTNRPLESLQLKGNRCQVWGLSQTSWFLDPWRAVPRISRSP